MPYTRTLKTGAEGVRGVVGDSLTPQLLMGFAQAFGTYLGGGVVVLGRDTRPSGEMARNALVGGLMATGCHVIDVGIAPVPTIQHAVRRHAADGGIAITSSHNPQEWNALKFIHRDGILLRPYQGQELLSVYYQGNFKLATAEALGQVEEDRGAIEAHLEDVLRELGDDFDLITERRPTVVVDCCNGAGALASETFLYALGCEVITLNDTPDGLFAHSPEPIPENLGQLAEAVREHEADLGFAQDADADRLCLVNELGEPISEEYTIAFACDALPDDQPGPIVANLSTSRMVDEAAARHGRPVIRTAVGEINIVAAMLREQAALGGEGIGGVIWPRAGYGKDSFAGMALILAGLARRGGTISDWQRSFRPGAIVKEKIDCSASLAQPVLLALRAAYADEQTDETEGLRVTWPDGSWLHVRPSNTEPIMRILAEADERSAAEARAAEAAAIVRQELSRLQP
ncbi:phosphoglucosamine mutase [bacterium]|nr:phosphoglucosamine mutase [bacterium]